MSELAWRLDWKQLRAERVRQAADAVARGLPGSRVRVEVEDWDCVSCYFELPASLAGGDEADVDGERTIELSFYDLEADGCVLCLEAEWSDNHAAWDAACEVAEAVAEALDARPIEL